MNDILIIAFLLGVLSQLVFHWIDYIIEKLKEIRK